MGEDCQSKKERQHMNPCILCTIFLVGLLILLLILYFSLFKPKDPRVQVPTMQLLAYSPLGGANLDSAASLSLNLQVSMYNPNRGDFIIQEGSTACLYYQNQQVGFTPIPVGTIPAQSFSTALISLSSSSPIPLDLDGSGSGGGGGGGYYAEGGSPNSVPDATFGARALLPIATSVTIIGHVTTADLFSHHSDVVSKCKVSLSVGLPRAYIQSYTCHSSYSLDD